MRFIAIEVDGWRISTARLTSWNRIKHFGEAAGFAVLRFTNLEVLNNISAVTDRIDLAISQQQAILRKPNK